MSDETPKTDDPMVAALLREREGYAGRKGKEDRVAAVDEQLQLRGYTPDGERIAEGGAPETEPRSEGGAPETEPRSEGGAPETEPRSTPPKGRQARSTEKA
ncbi:hypothetical protein [Streptomyces pseudovenezuelae]|uniref:hypothetical protein n=1 Tax=Streptomyces pseudovenezuelae TaxID=67350 RepID=UPI0036EB677F